MAIKRENFTTPAGVTAEYTKIESIGMRNNSVTLGLRHYVTPQARIDGKAPINSDTADVLSVSLTAEESHIIMNILYQAMKQNAEYADAEDIDPDEWKITETLPEGEPANG